MNEVQPEVLSDIQTTAPSTEIISRLGDVDVPDKFRSTKVEDIAIKALTSYKHLESKQGSMISMPSEDSGPDRWTEFTDKVLSTGKFIPKPDLDNPEQADQFFKSIGRPDKPEEYPVELPEHFQFDVGLIEVIKGAAHQSGCTSKQFKDLSNAYVQYELEVFNKSLTEGDKTLRQVWGADYDNRLNSAKAATTAYAAKFPDAVKALVSSPAGSNPALIAMLSDLGFSMHEKGQVGVSGGVQRGMTPEMAEEKIEEILANPNHPFNDVQSQDFAAVAAHERAVAKMQQLQIIALSGHSRGE